MKNFILISLVYLNCFAGIIPVIQNNKSSIIVTPNANSQVQKIKTEYFIYCVENKEYIETYSKGQYLPQYHFNNNCFPSFKMAEKCLDNLKNQSFLDKFNNKPCF